MKLKRILSSLLLVAVVFTSIIAAYPIKASAAYSSEGASTGNSATADLAGDKLAEYLNDYIEYDYETAEAMLADELAAGYLYSVNSANSRYSLYVNKYTGFVYYVNNITGQILTSNPIDPGYLADGGIIAIEGGERQRIMSQIEIKFYETANTNSGGTYTSYRWSALRSQITISPIKNGVRVNYVLGDTTPRFLLPGAITVKNFEEYILKPMFESYVSYLMELCEEYEPDYNYDFFENEDDYIPYDDYGYINTSSVDGILRYISNAKKLCAQYYSTTSKEYKALYDIDSALTKIVRNYYMENPEEYEEDDEDFKKLVQQYPILGEGKAIYIYNLSDNDTASRRQHGNYIKTYCPEYTFTMMYADERECGYVDKSAQKPVFRCALEYSFNSDGSLSASLPASSITFDETVYTLEYIRPLEFFGCADASQAGYVFYPDGSGTIIDFKDFYRPGAVANPSLSLSSKVYGTDYAYSSITGVHRQQVTMPVYGVVTETVANATTKALYGKETVTNGYFAIIEDGASLATLWLDSGGSAYKYGSVYTAYTPYPIDTFELSETISVGGLGSYKMVSDAKYTGSYKTRYVMLTDEEIGGGAFGYNADYVGMATCYRDYLKANGTLTALELVSADLPLYVEALGAMDIMTRILSFPVSKTVPLTTFDDVLTMYDELSRAYDLALEKAVEAEAAARAATDPETKAALEEAAKECRAFAESVENISNINFRLTGFANGGMKSTYPTKARWERACGGDEGFEALLVAAESASLDAGVNFGVYPEFDFMYITNTAMFDGISNRGTVAKMVDNRYASLQFYNSTLREFESVFDLVVSSDALDKLYTKFEKSFSKSESSSISLSTLGSSLNSNFDEKNPVSREESRENVEALLERITATDGYDVMLDGGNVYTIKYATHLLNTAIDSSHFRYSSYSIPFTGLVLHGYVNYTGLPLNYSGNVNYEILKSIESGAAPYYILCYQNSSSLKEDADLNKYYGVSYQNWYDDIVKTYAVLNGAIGDLQDYEITNHKIVICERVIEDEEMAVNYVNLQNEIVELLAAQLSATVDEAYAALKAEGEASYAKRLKLNISRTALVNQFADILNLKVSEIEGTEFMNTVDAIINRYQNEYNGAMEIENSYPVSFDSIDYTSKYSYVTDSCAFDKNYVKTDYTIDNGNVTMVSYTKGADSVVFFINYNNFSVDIRLDADTVITLEKFSFERIG